MNSPLNPNFWVCDCPADPNVHVHSVFAMACPKCRQICPMGRRATQQEVNDDADQVQGRARLAKELKHQLPEQRQRPAPSREEFEAADDYLKKPFDSTCSYAQWNSRMVAAELVVKRYKHANDKSDQTYYQHRKAA